MQSTDRVDGSQTKKWFLQSCTKCWFQAILYYYFTNTDDNHAKCPTIMQQYYCYIHTYIILIVLTCNVNVHNSIERLKGLRIRRPKFGYIPVR